MVDSFEAWANSSTKWGNELLQLGASWDTFGGDQETAMNDLVEGGIPRLAARSIFKLATEAIRRNSAPMAVFWDFEYFPVPRHLDCATVVERLKQTLTPFGSLTQFRCYLNSTTDDPGNAKERVEILAAGCYPTGRSFASCSTELMIAVDAMKFAYTNAECATLCFIVDPSRILYLLSDLQQSCWRTVVIASTSAADSLQSHWTTISLDWNEIIGTSSSSIALEPPPGYGTLSEDDTGDVAISDVRSHTTEEMSSCASQSDSEDVETELLRDELVPLSIPPRCNSPGLENGLAGSSSSAENHTSWIAVSGQTKKERNQKSTSRLFPISKEAPIPLKDLPLEIMAGHSTQKPFALFLRWSQCKKDLNDFVFPHKQCHVVKDKSGMIIMFQSHQDVENYASKFDCLRKGVLVDWENLVRKTTSEPCSICKASFLRMNMITASNRENKFYCQGCYAWGTPSEKKAAFLAVSSTMHLFEANDDIFVPDGLLRKSLLAQHPQCTSLEKANLWIEGATRKKFVVQVKRSGSKTKLLCLPGQEMHVSSITFPNPFVTWNTFEEEAFVVELLMKTRGGWLKREAVIASLKNKFASMQTPDQRLKLIENGRFQGLFFLVKSPLAQIVALHEENALQALDQFQMQQQCTTNDQDRQSLND